MGYITREEVVIEPSDITVSTVNSKANITANTDLTVDITKKEYTIVGDSLYASTEIGTAPQWLVDIMDNVTDTVLNTKLEELTTAINNISIALAEIEVLKNQYSELITLASTPDSITLSRLEALNTTVASNQAQILALDVTKTTANEATAISIDNLTSSINDGAIRSEIINLDATISNNLQTANTSINALTSVIDGLGDDVSGNSSAITALSSDVLLLSDGVSANSSDITSLTASVSTLGTTVSGHTTQLNTVDSRIADGNASVTAQWAYNSNLTLNGVSYQSGFGLATSATSGSGLTGTDSEFWIKADKFRLMSASGTMKSSYSPFSVDATTGAITFNGVVSFTNVTDVPSLGSTPQQVVDAVNAGSTTTINGSKITTGSVTASQIAAGSISAGKIDAGVLYNIGGNSGAYTMMVNFNTGEIHIK